MYMQFRVLGKMPYKCCCKLPCAATKLRATRLVLPALRIDSSITITISGQFCTTFPPEIKIACTYIYIHIYIYIYIPHVPFAFRVDATK